MITISHSILYIYKNIKTNHFLFNNTYTLYLNLSHIQIYDHVFYI